eukprot:gene9326-5090_t
MPRLLFGGNEMLVSALPTSVASATPDAAPSPPQPAPLPLNLGVWHPPTAASLDALDGAGEKRKAKLLYNCSRCGQVKKGHVCTAPAPAPLYTCSRCGQVKKGHVCTAPAPAPLNTLTSSPNIAGEARRAGGPGSHKRARH